MNYSPEEKVYIWLDSFPLDEKEKRRLLKEAGSPAALARDFLRFGEFLIKSGKEGVYNNMAASLADGGEYFRKTAAELEKERILAVTPPSEFYPEALRGMADPPVALYARGNVSLLKRRLFTVVGSRRTPPAALRTGAEICRELSSAFTIVTGTADGGDSAAIEGALHSGQEGVIAVLAGGFSAMPQGNYPLLAKVEREGLLLSAHTYRTPVRAYSYERRNALLAALGEGTFVLGAGEKSGALITAGYAFSAGKPVFALPYPPGASVGTGCNALIKKGAYLTENSVDILGRFGLNLKEPGSAPSLSPEEAGILEALKEFAEAHVSELSARTGLPPFRLFGVLSSLEVKGLIVRLGGNRFAPL